MVDGMPEQLMTGGQERPVTEGNVLKIERGACAEERDRIKEISLGVEVSCVGKMGVAGDTRTERK